MSTAERTRRPANPDRARDPQVYHPLDRLRGTIRRYVVIEGVLSACLFVAMWFTLGLIFDFGLFKVSGWDWALDGVKAVRVLALLTALGLFAGILVFRILRRVTKEFSYPALALVLERKFPKLLGDRLITAVEMADVEAMGKFGYSKDMIRATIAEARERVAKVPVSEVFNWKRLWMMGFLAAGLVFATVAASFASHAVATKSVSPIRFAWKFAHVTGIFLERNVALMNTPWPRRAHVELIGFPATEATVSRDVATVPIAARAYKWVIADRAVPEGWRPMLWSDVSEKLVGRGVPEFDFQVLRAPDEPAGSMSNRASEWTVDAVERRLLAAEGAGTSHPSAALGDKQAELEEVFKALNAKADQPSMGRTLRKLELSHPVDKLNENGEMVKVDEPIEVSFQYYGSKFRGGGTLTAKQNNEFTGDIGGLKEDVEFVVKADDFATRPHRIRLIPAPTLKRLYRVQEEPAYLHHAPPQGSTYDDLKGRRQLMAEKNLSLTGERSVVVVPAGTQVSLFADAYADDAGVMSDNDAIINAYATPVVGRFPGAVLDADGKMTQAPVPLRLTPGGKGFSIVFKNHGEEMDLPTRLAASVLKGVYPEKDARANFDFRLKDPVEFKVTWTNKYNVSATRTVLIQVAQDQPPVVEVGVDVIRKVGNVYLVTPLARIPLNPDSFVKDDHGLSMVEYAYNYAAEDSDLIRALRAQMFLRSFLPGPAIGSQALPTAVQSRWHAENFRNIDKSDDRRNGVATVGEFDEQVRGLNRITRDQLDAALTRPSGDDTNPEAVRKIDLRTDRDVFDLDARYKDGPKKGQRFFPILADQNEPQPTYRMDVYVQATDNNADADGGPRVTRSSEPIRLRIVSEGDLLSEISKEEEALGIRLEEALVKLAAAKRKYDFVISTNGFKEEKDQEVDAVKVRHLDALQDLDKARDIVQTVSREFRRIARECQVNRVIDITTKNYLGYCTDLEDILSDDPVKAVTFPKTQGMMNAVQNTLNGGKWAPRADVSDAQRTLYALAANLQIVRDKIGKTGTIEILKQNVKLLRDKQRLVDAVIKKLQEDFEADEKAPTVKVAPADPVALKKGETKKVQHTINWRQYKEDEVVVKLVASDPSLVVPAGLTLTFEKNQFRFEYEVKAGMKEGNYTITLTPGAGKPVEVSVTVK